MQLADKRYRFSYATLTTPLPPFTKISKHCHGHNSFVSELDELLLLMNYDVVKTSKRCLVFEIF